MPKKEESHQISIQTEIEDNLLDNKSLYEQRVSGFTSTKRPTIVDITSGFQVSIHNNRQSNLSRKNHNEYHNQAPKSILNRLNKI